MKAKALAVTVQPDKNGNYLARTSVTVKGEKIMYVVIWMPKEKIIGGMIIQGNQKGVVAFNCNDGHYEMAVFVDDQAVAGNQVPVDVADQAMQEVLSHFGGAS